MIRPLNMTNESIDPRYLDAAAALLCEKSLFDFVAEAWKVLEPGSAGKSVTAYLARRLAGFSVAFDRPTGAKEVRAQPFASQCGISNVALVAADWNAVYLDELSVFPNGRYDDQVDASSGAFTRLTRYPEQFVPPTSLRLPQVPPIRRGIPFEPHAGRWAPFRLRRPESA